MAVPKEIDTITVEVKGATEISPVLTLRPTSGTATSPIAQFTLVPAGEGLDFDVNVTGLLGRNVVVRQDAHSYCVRGERRAIAILLSRSCSTQACTKGLTTCWYGACVDTAQTPLVYEPSNPPKPQAPVIVADAGADAFDAAIVIDGGDAVDLRTVDASTFDLGDSAPDAIPDIPMADSLHASDDIGEASATDTADGIGGAGGIRGTGGNTIGTGGAGGTTAAVNNCLPLTKPTNGDVSMPSTTPGSIATYTCSTGYSVSGQSTVKCNVDGNWSDVAPTCVRDCGDSPSPASGTVKKTGTTVGSTATYTCPTGYSADSASILTCRDDGHWSGTAPTCTIMSCSELGPPPHGSINATTLTYQSKAIYQCSPGYTLTGPAERTCQADGKWSDLEPTCPPVDCGPLAAPTNGSVTPTPDTTLGATAAYSCDKGYAPSGGSPRQCQATGQWSGTAPTCEVNCGQPTIPVHGGASIPAAGTWKGATIQYFCYGDLQRYPSSASSSTCQADGTWSGTPPSCLCLGSAVSGWGDACQVTCASGTTVTGMKGCSGTCWEAVTKCP